MEMKCDSHGWVDARHFCHKCVADYLTRIKQLEGELGLMLEYWERGTPYWYGDSPADRIRSVLTKPKENTAHESRLRQQDLDEETL